MSYGGDRGVSASEMSNPGIDPFWGKNLRQSGLLREMLLICRLDVNRVVRQRALASNTFNPRSPLSFLIIFSETQSR